MEDSRHRIEWHKVLADKYMQATLIFGPRPAGVLHSMPSRENALSNTSHIIRLPIGMSSR